MSLQQIVLITVPASLHASQQPELRDDFSEEEEVRFVSNYAPSEEIKFPCANTASIYYLLRLDLLLGMIHNLVPCDTVPFCFYHHYIVIIYFVAKIRY